jgi:hypothetical protein
MDKSDAIAIGMLAFFWMGALGMMALCWAITFENSFSGFISLMISLWPFLLLLGGLVIFTVGFLVGKVMGWNTDELFLAVIDRLGSVFIILVMIAVYIWAYHLLGYDLSTLIQYWPLTLISLVPGVYLCYQELYKIVNPLTDEQISDLKERELNLNLPYNMAFTLCKNAIDMLDATDITDNKIFDPGSGAISIEVSPLHYLGIMKKPTRVTISLNQTDAAVTHVTISGITPDQWGSRMPTRKPTGLNEEYVNRIARYLRGKNPGNMNDDSPPVNNA